MDLYLIKKYLLIFIIGLLIIVMTYITYVVIIQPLSVEGNENFILQQVQSFYQKPSLSSLYPPLDQEPYAANPYSPLFQITEVGLIKLFNLDVSHSIGRIMSICFLLVTVFFVYLITQKYLSTFFALFWSTTILFCNGILLWGLINRVDMMGLAFCIIGLYLITKQKTSATLGSLLFFILALAVKITFLAAPLAVIVYLLAKDRKSGLWYGTSFAILAIALFLLFNYYTNGQFYYHTIVVNQQQTVILNRWQGLFDFLLIWPASLLVVPLVYFLARGKRIAELLKEQPLARLWLAYFLFASIFTFGFLRAGAGYNYFYELLIAMLIVTALAWFYFKTYEPTNPVLKLSQQPSLVIIFLLFNLLFIKFNLSYIYNYLITSSLKQLPNQLKVIEKLKQLHGGDFFEETMFYSPYVPGRWYLSDSRIFVQLAEHKIWDQTVFLNKIHQGEFKAIILNGAPIDDRKYDWHDGNAALTQEMIDAIKESYRLGEVIGKNFLYYPATKS